MKNKCDIYCDYKFWECFSDLESEVIRDRRKRNAWDLFYKFLTSNTLYFNVAMQHVNEETNGGKNLLELRQEKGGAGIKFIPKKFPLVENLSNEDDNHLNSVFLTMLDTEKCEELSIRFGVLVFNIQMIFSAEHVFVDNGEAFTKANGQNWKFLFDLKRKCPSISCCNSLIIADRYLLANVSEKVLSTNLKPIFDALLPYNLNNNIVFTICIIAEKMGSSFDYKPGRIIEMVRSLRPELRFILNIFHSKNLHDRSILTNNILLTSGAGFDVIGEDEIPLKFTTTSLVFPFLHSSDTDKSNYFEWINNVLKEEQKCRSYKKNYWGSKVVRHHLLDYYYEEPVVPRATFSLGDAFREKLLSSIIS